MRTAFFFFSVSPPTAQDKHTPNIKKKTQEPQVVRVLGATTDQQSL